MQPRGRRKRLLLLGLLALGLLAPPMHGEQSHVVLRGDDGPSVANATDIGGPVPAGPCGLCLATGHARKGLDVTFAPASVLPPRVVVRDGRAGVALLREPFHGSPAAPRAPPTHA
jgi:hypothetical protein